MSEHEVHEIQLNGKQLFFMFMAATVVSVVIFLCGVMVGRGVRPPEVDVLASAGTLFDSNAPLEDTRSASAPPSEAPAVPEHETLTYAERLESPAPLDEPLKPTPSRATAQKPAVAPAVAEKPAPEPPANSSFAEPPGAGYVIQVMAYPTRAEADALAKRLDAKGYPAFVTVNDDAPRVRYRVRVGKYPNKRDRDAVALRLKQEERFEPWLIP
jgi:cell division septation protein DedD